MKKQQRKTVLSLKTEPCAMSSFTTHQKVLFLLLLLNTHDAWGDFGDYTDPTFQCLALTNMPNRVRD
jgi:hypothetical protein